MATTTNDSTVITNAVDEKNTTTIESSKTKSNTTTTTTTTTRIVSAPGKMLMAGGYLVLNESEIGLVIGVNARFYASCCTMMNTHSNNSSDVVELEQHTTTTTTTTTTTKIRVISSQFQQEWNYIWDRKTFTLNEIINNDDDDVSQYYGASSSSSSSSEVSKQNKKKKNPFLEKALRIVLLYIDHYPQKHDESTTTTTTTTTTNGTKDIVSLTIHIVGDNDFYSLVPHLQLRQLNKNQIYELPKCLPIIYQESTGNIYKTGLGSSACLVTAVIGAILTTTTTTTTTTSTDTTISDSIKQIIERLSQIGHCYAQGKIGSGFDVAAAIYGSHIYQRFSPSILTNLLSLLDHNDDDDDNNNNNSNNIVNTMNMLYNIVHDDNIWKSNTIQPITCFASNTFLQVMMADVSGGSESPSMAKQILSWRTKYIQEQQQQQAVVVGVGNVKVPHWDDVSTINRQIIVTLQQIHTLVPTADQEIQQLYIDTPVEEWKTRIDLQQHVTLTELLLALQELYKQQRYHMKQMGILAGNVPVEPDIQTTLCNDVTTNVSGVLATMVPGAGGYDAISILYINHSMVHANITNYLSEYSKQNVCALTVQGVAYNDGLRIETEFPV